MVATIQSSELTFFQVGGESQEKMPLLTEIFHKTLKPLYGPQDKALSQIELSRDRVCFLLCEKEIPKGLLVFKTLLSNEHQEFNISESIEIKSLFLVDPTSNSGRGLGSILLQKLYEEIEHLPLTPRNIHVTVSATKPESLAFFQKKGFSVIHLWKDRYQPGATEYLLACPYKIQADNQKLAA